MSTGQTAPGTAVAGGAPEVTGRGARAPRPRPSYGPGFFVKWALLIVFNGLVLAFVPRFIDQQSWLLLAYAVLVTVAVDLVYASRRRIPGKYLVPGMVFLLLFGVFPVIYNLYISFTNYGTGNVLTKDQAVEVIEENSLQAASDESPRYRADVVEGPDGLFLVLQSTDGEYFVGTSEGLEPADPEALGIEGERLVSYDGQPVLNLGQKSDRADEITAIQVPTDNGALVMNGLTEAREVIQRYQYDADRDVMVDTVTGTEYVPVEGTFTAPDGATLSPGWTVVIGFDNYHRLFTTPQLRDAFVRVFVWTVVFSSLTVLTTFALGLLLAMVFNDEGMKGRRTYRTLMILPYALPAFLTILVWRGMLNETFGIINKILPSALEQPWLNDGNWAKFSMLLVNLWLGFPYMFLVTTGALQGIPTDLREAAFVDGATGFGAFRRITLPLLLIAVAPVLISSFAFNFNNYTLVRQLTNGGPPIGGSLAGETDIMISYSWKIAFGGAGADYGLATAISTIIFIIVALISAVGFRYTRALEEVR